MQFLKALFWLVLGFVIALFLYANSGGQPVEINIWGDLIVSVKLPVLLVIMFLLGFLPTFIIYRTRLWALQRRLEAQAQAHVVSRPAPPARPVPAANAPDRQATDAKAWPAE
jgi:lipopolysaccharide assembly protein A